MQEEELEGESRCVDCGAWCSPVFDVGWPLVDGQYLCLRCALARGGRFDAALAEWVQAPEVADLLDDRFA